MRLNLIRLIYLWGGITGACMVLGFNDELWARLAVYFALCFIIFVASLDKQ